MTLINKVVPFGDYRILIELSNENMIVIDFAKKLKTFRFSSLENKMKFRKVYTDGFSVIWNNGEIRVSLAELIEMLQSTKELFKVV